MDVTRGDARYMRIAGEIEGWIAAGRLRPGDRLPSARRITQEWGVAIATATKVLAALQRAGLARSVPGVGTVVAEPPPSTAPGAAAHLPDVASPSAPATASPEEKGTATGTAQSSIPVGAEPAAHGRRRDAEPELSRERIVRAAVAVADAEGLSALSMRRIAAELGVATMSLYRHVPGKEELLLFMSDLVFGGQPLPEPGPGGWREALELVARRQWAMYRAHPWLVHTISFTRPALAPNGMEYTEFAMRSLDGLGLDIPERLMTVLAIFSAVHGVAVNLDWEREAEHESGLSNEEWMQAQEQEFMEITATRFPLLGAVARIPDFDVALDDLFELNLSLLLDGLDARYARRSGGSGRSV